MKYVLLKVLVLSLIDISFSQRIDTTIVGNDTIIIVNNTSPADSLMEEGDLNAAIDYYRDAYEKEGVNFGQLYNYACALSVDLQIDSAFKYLELAIKQDLSPYLFTDPDFLNLRKDARWNAFEKKTIELIENQTGKTYNDINYTKSLWYMHATDQAYYDCIDLATRKIGRKSPVTLALWDLKQKLNVKNQKELERLIELKGWPKISQVGSLAAGAAFLVIQHSDIEKQIKYLPVIEALCKENEASWDSYALMYDRIQIQIDKPQKYGTQVRFNNVKNEYELFPLLDKSMVKKWREEVGLEPIESYLLNWGIVFPLDED